MVKSSQFGQWGDAVQTRRAENGNLIVEGYAAKFNRDSKPMMGGKLIERIAPGAFSDSLQRGDVAMVWNHNPDIVLARQSNGLLQLREDNTGLAFTAELGVDSQAERDAAVAIEKRNVYQMSFGFFAPAAGDMTIEKRDGVIVRTLNKIDLFEISPVAFPAYADTEIYARDMVEAAMEPLPAVDYAKLLQPHMLIVSTLERY